MLILDSSSEQMMNIMAERLAGAVKVMSNQYGEQLNRAGDCMHSREDVVEHRTVEECKQEGVDDITLLNPFPTKD